MQDIIDTIDNLIKNHNLNITPISLTNLTTYKSDIDSLPLFLSSLKQSEALTDLFAADFLNRSKRFEVTYNLLSLKLNQRILVKIEVGEEETVKTHYQNI